MIQASLGAFIFNNTVPINTNVVCYEGRDVTLVRAR